MAFVLGAAIAAVAVGLDGPGRLLAGIAAAALLLAAGWLLGGPVLRADTDGVAVRGWVRTHETTWPEIRRILVDTRRRSAAIEVETDLALLVVPALLLGRVRPAEAARAVQELRPVA